MADTRIILPGPFVVLQGMQGDGLWNTIDSVPIVLNDDDEEFHHVTEGGSYTASHVVVDYDDSIASSSGEQHHHHVMPTIHQSPMTTLDPMLASTNMPPLALNPLTQTTAAHTGTSIRRSTLDHDSFIVVDDRQQQQSPQHDAPLRNRAEERAIEAWNVTCRSREVRQRHEWLAQEELHQHQPTLHRPLQPQFDWWQSDGRLAIFSEIPCKQNGMIQAHVKATLSPGMTIVGTQIIYLDADTLDRLSAPGAKEEHPNGISQQVQLLKLESPHEGYVVFSFNGYCFLGPGLPSQYVLPEKWLWRVTYKGGAFVREGLELNSRHIVTLPFGSVVQVSRKTISPDGGLSRLFCQAILSHDEGATPVKGWISEYLNPTSTTGERGPIVQPIPFPVPALYQVTLKEGALIRSDVELSSKQIGHAPYGAVLCVVGRAFSEHPQDKCIERLKLAGNGGWVSVRLNKQMPDDVLVFELKDVDGSFDPDNPGMFHLNAQSSVDQEVSAEFEGADLSSIDESNESSTASSISVIRGGVATDGPLRHGYSEGNCIACLSEIRNATIVHGETGHIACCLKCARILKAQGKDVSGLCLRAFCSYA